MFMPRRAIGQCPASVLPERTSSKGILPSDVASCEGFRTPAVTNVSTRTAAGVRKPPRDETAGRGTYWAVPRAQLWGFERHARSQREGILNGRWSRMRAQLKRYGMDIAKWGFEVSGHMRFQRVRRGKNITCHNL